MKTSKLIVPAITAAVLFVAGGVSAQTGASATASPGTGTAPAGTQVNLGTVAVTSPNGGSVTSLPITFTSSGGATLGHLSNCQLYNVNGQTLTTGANVVSSVGSNAATFTLNAPLAVSATPTTLTVRCDVGSTIPSSGMFSYTVGAPSMSGTAPVPTAPALSVNLDVAPSVPRGSADVALANLSLNAGTSSSVTITSIPLNVSAGGNALLAHLSDCRVRDASNVSGSLSGAFTLSGSGATVFSLTSPLVIAAGANEMLSFTCDVNAATPIGGTYTITVTPGNVTGTNSAGGSVAGVPVTGTGPSGLPAATTGTVIVTGTVSGGNGTGGTGDGTPGVPNTGLGGTAAATLGVLILAALIALGGTYMLRRA